MTARNAYSTLAEYKARVTDRGQTSSTDTADDTVIGTLLEAASRYIDSKAKRWFYPRIETRYYSTPDGELNLDADLLEVLTLTNGDAATIASTEYNLLPKNDTPYYGLKLTGSTSVAWESDSNGNTEYVISLLGIYGFHNHYVDGWVVGSTLAEDLDVDETAWDVTAGTLFSAGQIVKVDNEICIIDSIATNTLTMIARGANGSTAAIHTTGKTVYYWQPMEDARNATLELTVSEYKRRFGEAAGGSSTITGAGVVIVPRDVPAMVEEFIKAYRRIV